MRHGVVCIDESHDGEEIKHHVATDRWNGGKPERGTLRLKQKSVSAFPRWESFAAQPREVGRQQLASLRQELA